MAVSRNNRQKNKKPNNDTDLFGLLLIIISAFFLVCLIIPICFSFVSESVRYVLLGLFGVFSYALFGGLFALGFCVFLGKKLKVDKQILWLAVFAFVLILIIVQTATNFQLYGKNFGDYLGAVYSQQYTAGGVVFGLISYAIAAALSATISLVVVSLVLAALLTVIGLNVYKKYFKFENKSRDTKVVGKTKEDPAQNAPQFSFPAIEREPISDTPSLFCGLIYNKNEPGPGLAQNYGAQPQKTTQINVPERDGRRKMSPGDAASFLYPEESPHQTSAPNNYSARVSDLHVSDYEPHRERQNALEKVVQAPIYQRQIPDAEETVLHKPPKKILHENKGLFNVVMPTIKYDDNQIPGEIIKSPSNAVQLPGNSDRQAPASYFGADNSNRESSSFYSNDDAFERREIISDRSSGIEPVFDIKKPEARSFFNDNVASLKKPTEYLNSNPIINSKSFSEKFSENSAPEKPAEVPQVQPRHVEEPAQRPFATSSAIIRSSSITDSVPAQQPQITPKTASLQAAPPTSPSVTQFSSNFARVDSQPKSAEKIDLLPIINQSQPFAPIGAQEQITAEVGTKAESLIVEDEVVDMTERGFDFGNKDTSGYYAIDHSSETQSNIDALPKIRKPRVRTSDPISGQISFDDKPELPFEEAIISHETPIEKYIYSRPSLDLLDDAVAFDGDDSDEISSNSQLIEIVLNDLGFPAKVINVTKGPTVTRYELQPAQGLSVKKINGKESDLEYHLSTKGVRIESPISGKQAIGIEVPNKIRKLVVLKEILDSAEFKNSMSALPLALGKDLGGGKIIKQLEKMPHLLVAGATGTGKSVCLNAFILSLIYHCSPEDMRIILIDPKCVEFMPFRRLPHMLVPNAITEPQHAVNALDWAIEEMNNRYKLFSSFAVKSIEEYNKMAPVTSMKIKKMPYIVFIVDELADLMLYKKKEVEDRIRNIAQKARAAGIHLILATQRPSVDIITGTIKINLPCRVAFKVTANPDSRTVLDQPGAESLIGNGDMLFMPQDSPDLRRLQGAFVSNNEITNVVKYVIENNKEIFDVGVEEAIYKRNEAVEDATIVSIEEENGDEKLLPNIMHMLITSKSASTSLLQRRFSIGYARAARIIDVLEQRGWIAKMENSKAREVYMTIQQYEEVFQRSFYSEE